MPFRTHTREVRLRRRDLPRLLALALAGGVLAPVLLLVGLQRVSGSIGSLLLNLEGFRGPAPTAFILLRIAKVRRP